MKDRAYPPGIRQTPWGWQVYCRVAGRIHSESYPRSTTIHALKGHLRDLRHRAEHPEEATPQAPPATTFAEDAATYLKAKVALRDYKGRERNILLWVEALGAARDRKTIKPHEVTTVLSQWTLQGYAANTVRDRRMALGAMFSTLDGRSAPNPARDAKAPPKGKRVERAFKDVKVAEAIIDRITAPKANARLLVMLWTGLPPQLIMTLQPEDIDLVGKHLYVRPREKGAGVEGRTLPLQPEAVAALRQLIKVKAFGRFSMSSIDRDWKKAAIAEDVRRAQKKLPPLNLEATTPYCLRHTFGRELARKTGDALAVMHAMMHATLTQAQHYIQGAAADRLEKAIASLTPSRSKRR